MALLGARRLRDLLDANGIRLTKSLGQNFVIDPNTIRKMIAAADIRPEDHVLEIGAGAGSLTVGLASAARRVTAVEVDDRLAPVLQESVGSYDNVDLIYADATSTDLAGLEAEVVVANLPYNIAATLVIKILEECPSVRVLTVMTQREVAERLAAVPGSKIYGQTSVLVAFDAAARTAGTVSRNAFFPVPNVDSSIVRLERRDTPPVDRGLFKAVVKAAFAQRRKTMRNCLVGVVGSVDVAEAILATAGIDPMARPETLDLDGFVSVVHAVAGTRR